jgi:hypothetical protein
MLSVSKELRQIYYNALQGNISVEVFKEDVSDEYNETHVVIRVEGEFDSSHKSGFVTNPTVITDIVGVFTNSIDPDVVDDIDTEIRAILLPDTNTRLQSSTIQITNLKPDTSNYVSEYDGTKKYYRKITRWTQRVSHS